MRFTSDGQAYDTVDLLEFPVDNSALPTIYATPDFEKVFVVTLTRWEGVRVHRADEAEIRYLIETYHLPQLAQALRGNPTAAAPPPEYRGSSVPHNS